MGNENPYQSTGANTDRLKRGPWIFRSLILGACGLALSLASVVYGVIMVGIPSQDPTPEMAEQEAFHSTVSMLGMAIGGCLLLSAIVAIILVLAIRFATRSRA